MTSYRHRQLSPYHRRHIPAPYTGGDRSASLFDRMNEEMEDLMSRFRSLWDDDELDASSATGRGLNQWDHSPAVDFDDDDDSYTLSVELPGVKSDDIDVTVTDNVLRITGEKRAKRESDEPGRSVRERSYGRFSRAIRLPENVNSDDIEASFEDGVLEIEIPKSAEAHGVGRRVEIAASGKSRASDGETSAERKQPATKGEDAGAGKSAA